MRAAWLLLAACGGGDTEPSPDASIAIDVSGFDVVVASQWVYVFPRFTMPHQTESFGVPDVGACGNFESDAIATFASPLTSVSIDGISLQHSTGGSSQSAAPYESLGGGVTAATTFHATDAGHTIDVPIHAGPYVRATDPTVTTADPSMTIQWQTDGADSVFVGVAGGYGLTGCRVAGSEHAYTFPIGPGGRGDVYVEAFAAPEVTETVLGPVRVFYGDYATTTYGM